NKSGNNMVKTLIKNDLYYYYLGNLRLNKIKVINSCISDATMIKNNLFIASFNMDRFSSLTRDNRNNFDTETKKMIFDGFKMSRSIIRDKSNNLTNDERKMLSIPWIGLKVQYMTSKNYNFQVIYKTLRKGERILKNDLDKITYYGWMSAILSEKYHNKIVIKFLLNALKYSKKLNQLKQTSFTYSGLSYFYLRSKKYNLALKYSLLAKKICEEIDYKTELGMIHKNMGDTYFMLANYEEAITSYTKSIEYKRLSVTPIDSVDYTSITIPMCSKLFCYIMLDKKEDLESEITYFENFTKNRQLPSDVPILFDFIKSYFEFKYNNDKTKLIDLKNNISKMKEKLKNSIYLEWMRNILIE
ncbi:MAG TPA: tetratricopeptide repeat protein, partial [Spirochaetota bacterium]|nr:tetratricopeptide repeat protein [Spirochaetota bacterium]